MRFFLDQHGCAKNQVDGEVLIGFLRDKGWERTEDPDGADLIIVNSCGFIESAKKESLDAVMTAAAGYPKAKVLLAGCLAERYADDLASGLSEAAGVFGNGDLSLIGEMVDRLFPGSASGGSPMIAPPQEGVSYGERPEILSFPRSVYVKITEGCDNWCSFCAIPLIRGSLRSRSIEAVVSECRSLVGRGFYELNLIGQDLASFGRGRDDGEDDSGPSPISRLLSGISEIDGDFRVRLLYIHPDHFPMDILPVMARDHRFLPYFDIPFQSGDPDILRAMNRKGPPEAYKALVDSIRSAFSRPDNPYGGIALRTTVLAGFPGETDEAFERTARFLADIRPTWSGSFAYSREEGTKAGEMKKRVAKKTVQTRLDTLLEIQRRITPEELSRFVGATVEVLVEELIPVEGDAGASGSASVSESPAEGAVPASRLALGRAWFQAPEVDGSVVLQFEDNKKDRSGGAIVPGSVVMAQVTAVNGVDVEAVVR